MKKFRKTMSDIMGALMAVCALIGIISAIAGVVTLYAIFFFGMMVALLAAMSFMVLAIAFEGGEIV